MIDPNLVSAAGIAVVSFIVIRLFLYDITNEGNKKQNGKGVK